MKETTKQKIDRYIRISQTPLGIRYRDHVILYKDKKLSDIEFCHICDQITMNHQRSGYKTREETKKDLNCK